MTALTLAGRDLIAKVTGQAPYPNGQFRDADSARINAAVVERTGRRLPCYATPGKRGGFNWVSVGSSCVIARSLAIRWLARYGVDLEDVEAWPDRSPPSPAPTLAPPEASPSSPAEAGARIRNFGWDRVRLSEHSFEDLNALRKSIEDEPANHMPPGSGSIYLYTPAARRKLDALAWAVTFKLQEARR